MAETAIQFHEHFGSVRRVGIVQAFSADNPIMDRLNFIKVPGISYQYRKDTSLGGADFRAFGANYTADAGGTSPVTERLVPFGGTVQTEATFVEAAGNEYRAANVARKLKAAGRFFMRMFFDGNSQTNPLSFDGLNQRLGTGTQTIKAGTNGAALTIDMVDELLDKVVGAPQQKVLLMSATDRRALSKLTRGAAGGATLAEAAGTQLPAYNSTPIVIVEDDESGNAILGKNETCGSSNVTGSIYAVRFGTAIDEEYLQGLITPKGFETEDQGKTGTQYLDLIDVVAGLAAFHARCMARLYGVL